MYKDWFGIDVPTIIFVSQNQTILSSGAVEYAECSSADGYDLRVFWVWKCKVTFNWHYSLVRFYSA